MSRGAGGFVCKTNRIIPSTMTIFQTKHLSLRKITLGDLDPLFEFSSDLVAMKHFPKVRNREESIHWINDVTASYQSVGYGPWAVLRKNDTAFLVSIQSSILLQTLTDLTTRVPS